MKLAWCIETTNVLRVSKWAAALAPSGAVPIREGKWTHLYCLQLHTYGTLLDPILTPAEMQTALRQMCAETQTRRMHSQGLQCLISLEPNTSSTEYIDPRKSEPRAWMHGATSTWRYFLKSIISGAEVGAREQILCHSYRDYVLGTGNYAKSATDSALEEESIFNPTPTRWRNN